MNCNAWTGGHGPPPLLYLHQRVIKRLCGFIQTKSPGDQLITGAPLQPLLKQQLCDAV